MIYYIGLANTCHDPAIAIVDSTGKVIFAEALERYLQTVKREWNEKYYNLIEAFYEITSVPILLNTSLNVMGKPIIHTVEDAISVFYTDNIYSCYAERFSPGF